MTRRRLNVLSGMQAGFILCLLYAAATYSDCAFLNYPCLRSMIGTDTLIVSCPVDCTYAMDTFSKKAELLDLKKEFDASDFCFLALVDTVINFQTTPAGTPCRRYKADSVRIRVTASYKGTVPAQYWFLDSLYGRPCDTNTFFWVEDADPGYGAIKGMPFLAFSKSLPSLRASNVRTSGCNDHRGYFIDAGNAIKKKGYHEYKTSGIWMSDSTTWIPLPLKDFVATIAGSNNRSGKKAFFESGPGFRIVQTADNLIVSARGNGPWRAVVFNPLGKVIASVSSRPGDVHSPMIIDKRKLRPGSCIIRMSDGETALCRSAVIW